MTEDERFALVGDIKEAEHRMRKARESGNRHAYRDALKWRDKSIRKLRENDKRKEAKA